MNPRYRRLLIPGLLVLLLVVVVVASFVQDAQASAPADEPQRVSVVDDPRISESSGLAVSRHHPDLAYTVNDSGHDAEVFAVRVSTGEVVGVTRLRAETTDVEAMALDDDGRLWVADTGDNRGARDEVALHVLDEPGEGDHRVRPTTYRVDYGDRSPDVEAIVVRDGTVSLLEKALAGGSRFELAVGDLDADSSNQAREVAADVPGLVTDATAVPESDRVVLRTYVSLVVLDADWRPVTSLRAPVTRQGETVAAEPSGRSVLVGSEGTSQPLWRVALPASDAEGTADVVAAPGSEPVSETASAYPVETRDVVVAAAVAAGVLVVVALLVVGLRRRRA
ncbi:hypothetical protein [Aeromicrobium sp. IC_218]|uniref:hypothetical protein n=1 Tax=Aeromicrobium sp. IC_218 TaxID=2545468 RepID=UPI00103CB82B|nr:hypothetical protein [Aeromicrobium sp. IC_218]TCI99017.1 hypothetical protein E0W78_07365 [Aeromicrobium sp. IC_218]